MQQVKKPKAPAALEMPAIMLVRPRASLISGVRERRIRSASRSRSLMNDFWGTYRARSKGRNQLPRTRRVVRKRRCYGTSDRDSALTSRNRSKKKKVAYVRSEAIA